MPSLSPNHEDTYDRLIAAIETSQGRLAILIAVCDGRSLREQVIRSYEAEARQAQIAPYRIELSWGGSIRGKLLELRQAHIYLQEGGEAVVTVTGAELLPGYNLTAEDVGKTPLEEFFGYLQWTREGMREFPFPVVLWLNHRLMKEISFKAPDFWSWRKGVFWFSEESETIAEFTTPVFSSDPRGGDARLTLGQTEQTSDKFLPPLVELQETIAELETTDPDSTNLATLYESLGDIYEQLIQKGKSPNPQQDAAQGFQAFRQAISRYRTQNAPSSQTTALLKLGNFLLDQSRFTEALEAFQEMLTIARQTADRWSEGAALSGLGLAYHRLGQINRAIDFHQQRLTIAREIGDRGGEGTELGNLGIAYNNLGQYDRAIDFHQQHLSIARELGDRRGEGTALGGLGIAYSNLGQCDRAIDFSQQHLTIAREIGDRRGEGNALGNLGITYRNLGQIKRAIDFYQQQLTITREIGDRRGEGNALGNLGDAYKGLGQYDQGINFHQQHLSIARELGDRWGEGTALGGLGIAYSNLGQCDRAIDFSQQHLTIAREIGDRRGEGNALVILIAASRGLRKYRQANNYFQQYSNVNKEMGYILGKIAIRTAIAFLHNLFLINIQKPVKLFKKLWKLIRRVVFSLEE